MLALVTRFDQDSFVLSVHGAHQLLLLFEHVDLLEHEAVLLRVHYVGLPNVVIHLSNGLGIVCLGTEFLGVGREVAHLNLVAAAECQAVDGVALAVGS